MKNFRAFTLAEAASLPHPMGEVSAKLTEREYTPSACQHRGRKLFAFTLAEVLITLGIIGIVAAMTMPVLINKIKDREYDRAREKALNSIGEAGRLLAVQGDIGSGTNAEDFVKNYLSKKLKIVKTCESSALAECGLSPTIKKLDGTTTMSMPKTRGELGLPSIANSTWKTSTTNYGFVTANGYAVNLFYNPNCTTDTNANNSLASGYACMNAIYDMNGLRNPNQVGKDIGFVTVLYPNETNRAVAPNPTPTASANAKWTNAQTACTYLGKEYSLPDKDELLSMAINGNLIDINNYVYWSSSSHSVDSSRAWVLNFSTGRRAFLEKNMTYYVRCVRR